MCPLWIPDVQVREAAYTWILERFGNSVDCHRNQDFPGYRAARLHEGHRSAASGGVPEVGASGHLGEVFTIGDSWNDIDMHRYR